MESTDNQRMHQDRKRHIENLKREIGLKFGRTIESAADFDLLSITIKQATSETISASTLKRIFGYVKYDAEPSATTLSILSRYVGYAGWSDFCRNYIPSESCDETRLKSIRSKIRRQKRLVSLLVTGCIALTALCIMLAVRLDNAIDAVSENSGTLIRDTVIVTAPPIKTRQEIAEEKYSKIRYDCIMRVKHMTDSIMSLRNSLPLYRYKDKCDSSYKIFTDYIEQYIKGRIFEEFPDNDTLRIVYNNSLYKECRDYAMILVLQFTHEEYHQAYKEKYGQSGNQRRAP